jgi:hypothetical protein
VVLIAPAVLYVQAQEALVLYSASVGEEAAAPGLESLQKAFPEGMVTAAAWDPALPPRPLSTVQAYVEPTEASAVATFAFKSLEAKGKFVLVTKAVQVGGGLRPSKASLLFLPRNQPPPPHAPMGLQGVSSPCCCPIVVWALLCLACVVPFVVVVGLGGWGGGGFGLLFCEEVLLATMCCGCCVRLLPLQWEPAAAGVLLDLRVQGFVVAEPAVGPGPVETVEVGSLFVLRGPASVPVVSPLGSLPTAPPLSSAGGVHQARVDGGCYSEACS